MTCFVPVIPMAMNRKVLAWSNVPLTKDPIFLIYSKWLVPEFSMLDDVTADDLTLSHSFSKVWI